MALSEDFALGVLLPPDVLVPDNPFSLPEGFSAGESSLLSEVLAPDGLCVSPEGAAGSTPLPEPPDPAFVPVGVSEATTPAPLPSALTDPDPESPTI